MFRFGPQFLFNREAFTLAAFSKARLLQLMGLCKATGSAFLLEPAMDHRVSFWLVASNIAHVFYLYTNALTVSDGIGDGIGYDRYHESETRVHWLTITFPDQKP